MKNLPTILIGCPVRNREWIIPRYLEGIYSLNYPKENIILYWLVNDSTDETYNILKDFEQEHQDEYKNIIIEKIKNRVREYKRLIKGSYVLAEKFWLEVYTNLANLRNTVINKVLELNADYLFNIDSDIIINDVETLNILLSENKPVISAIINNDQIRNPLLPIQKSACNILNFDSFGKVKHIIDWELNSTFKIHITGAICLYNAEIFNNSKVRFGYSRYGEDIYMAERILEEGIEVWTTSKVLPNHIMAEGLFDVCNKCANTCFKYRYMHGERQDEIISCPNFKEKLL